MPSVSYVYYPIWSFIPGEISVNGWACNGEEVVHGKGLKIGWGTTLGMRLELTGL